jgi:hypothetical protein
MRRSQKRQGQEGHSILEFALVAIPTVMMLLGVVVIGINLGRSVSVGQICRDGASMYVRGLDFSTTGAKQMLARLGQNMNLQVTGGSGIVILSRVKYAPTVPGCISNCTYKYKLMQRIIMGNTGLPGTHYPTVGSVTYDSKGNVVNYQTDNNAEITGFASTLPLTNNEEPFFAEAYFQTSDVTLNVWQSSPGIYAQAFF